MIDITTKNALGTQSLFTVAREEDQQSSVERAVNQERTMLITKYCSIKKLALLSCVLALIQPLSMQSASESERIEKLERAVELLQKQNTELKAQVSNLKSKEAGNPAEGKFKTKVSFDGKTYVEKAVEEKLPVYAAARAGIETGAGWICADEF